MNNENPENFSISKDTTLTFQPSETTLNDTTFTFFPLEHES